MVKIKISKSFQVGVIIAKHPGRVRGRNSSQLRRLIFRKIQKHLRIKEESKVRDKNENSYDNNNKANVVNKPLNTPNKGKQNQGNVLGPKKE